VKIWLTSSKRSLHNLAQVLTRRSCGDPEEFLSNNRPVQVLVRRFCGDPGQNLSKKSLLENLADAMS
jgi:hypothetical protein